MPHDNHLIGGRPARTPSGHGYTIGGTVVAQDPTPVAVVVNVGGGSLWLAGGSRRLVPVAGSTRMQVDGISDNGLIAGFSVVNGSMDGTTWSAADLTGRVLPGAPHEVWTVWANARGEVLGEDSSDLTKLYLWPGTGAGPIVVDSQKILANSSPIGLTDSGAIVLSSSALSATDAGCIWSSPAAPCARLDFSPKAVSPNGFIVGTSGYNVVLRTPAGTERVIIAATTTFQPGGVNNSGVVIGQYIPPVAQAAGRNSPTVPEGDGSNYSAVYEGGQIVEIRGLFPAGTGYVGLSGINSRGDLIGYFYSASGDLSGYVLTHSQGITVAASLTVPTGGLGSGGTLQVPVRVTAGIEGLTGVSVTLSGTTGRYAVVTAPPAAVFGLAAGASRTLVWTIKGVDPGVGTLTASATGRLPDGTVVTDSDSHSVPVIARDLVVSAGTVAEVRLPVSAEAKVGTRQIVVTVRLRYVSKKVLSAVALQRVWVRPVDGTQQLNQIDFAKKSFPLRIGKIPAGKSVLEKFSLTVTGDGEYKIDTLATYGIPGGNARTTSSGGVFEVLVAPLWFNSKLAGSSSSSQTPVIKGGGLFRLSGEIRNLSSYKTLCLWPLLPDFKGNGGGVGPIDIRFYGSGLDEIAPPVAGPLKPGETLPFGMSIRTSNTGSTRLDLKLNLGASVLKAGVFCDATTASRGSAGPALAPVDRTIVKGSLEHRGAIDVSVPVAQPINKLHKVYNFFGGFTIGSISTLGEWFLSTCASAKEALSGYTRNPHLLIPTLESAYAAAGFQAHYWESATPAEKQSFGMQLASVFRRAPGDTWRAAVASSGAANAKWLTSVEAAYASGDDREIYQALGNGPGGLIADTVKDIVMAEIGIRIAKEVPFLASTFAVTGGEGVTFSSWRTMPAGKLLNAGERAALWGESASEGEMMSAIAKSENVLIGVRGRSPISVQNLAEGAVFKYEKIKPKNVSSVDIKWLGFFSEDAGLVAMRTYSAAEEAAILAKIRNAVMFPWTRKGILTRAAIRFAEAPAELRKLEEFAKVGEVEVGVNYRENGMPGTPAEKEFRNFAMTEQELPSKSTYYRPWQQNITLTPGAKIPKWCIGFGGTLGILCRITGDMDGVYVTDLAGGGLPLTKLLRVYQLLEAAGWQHPETFTWTKLATGEFWFQKKQEILEELTKGNQMIMEYAPDGKVRAVYLNLKKSMSLSKSAADFFVVRDGGYVALPK